jgi:thymidylate synthase
MNLISVRNAHAVLPIACEFLETDGVRVQTRNGPALVVPHPVTTIYSQPRERVSFWPERDANPFLHFMDAMWCLGGKQDIATLTRFAKSMAQFSDDGVTHHGAYGSRWRKGFPGHTPTPGGPIAGVDQLRHIGAALRDNREDRRQVLQIWDAMSDLGNPSKDVPCNVTATFQVCPNTGRLNLVVFNRSNDIVWGAYGANVVQFSYLLEYVAARAELQVGMYWQVSVNWHGYDATFGPLREKLREVKKDWNPYVIGSVEPYTLIHESADTFDEDLKKFLSAGGRAPIGHFQEPFFEDVAMPIVRAHDYYKDGAPGDGRYELAMNELGKCRATDWRRACQEWIDRRWKNYRKAAVNGPAE